MQWRRRRSVLLNVVATAAELTVGKVILHALAVFDFDVKLGTFQHVENNVEPDLDIALALSAGAQEPLDLPPGRSSVSKILGSRCVDEEVVFGRSRRE